MNAHSIRHAWFPPAIPKRKYERDGDGGEIDVESEWPSAYRALSAGGPGTGTARPAKRLRALEGGLAGLSLKTPTATAPTTATTTTTRVHAEPIKINTSPSLVSSSENQIHDAPLEGEIEPYISSIYEWASPHTGSMSAGIGSSVASLPLCGEVSEVNTSDESDSGGRSGERKSRKCKGRMGEGVFVHAEQGMPGYTVYEPEWGPEKRKREQGDEDDDTHLPEKKGKRTWYEPEKDRIVILDLDSSEDESVNRSPRRRRSAFSLSSSAPGSPVTRPRSHTEAQPEYVINHTLLAHISPPGTREGGPVSIPREEDPSKAVVLYKPAPWVGSSTEREGNTADESEAAPMEASPLIRDDDAMDIDM